MQTSIFFTVGIYYYHCKSVSYHQARLRTEPHRHVLDEADTYIDETVRYHRQSNTAAAYWEYSDGTADAVDSHTEPTQAAS